jgi:bifunctional UDP-N-acetylglucosamine pyrophosphorylase/glucosamine-1-phosphate N-acetyltransferase
MGSVGTVLVLAAGQGTRMRSAGPKVLHPICGRPLLGWVLDQARALDPERILVVVGHGADLVRAWVAADEPDPRIAFVEQREQKGTGHAVATCLEALGAGGGGAVLVLYGDMPLLEAETLRAIAREAATADAVVSTAIADEPRGFGRIKRVDGAFAGIVEERDASAEERAIREVNVGVFAFRRDDLLEFVPRLGTQNAQGEYYLTDVLALLRDAGRKIATVTLADPSEGIGVNNLAHLAEARRVLQERVIEGHLLAGVLVEDPRAAWIDHGVTIGAGTCVLPCTVIRSGAQIGAGCVVGPFAHVHAGAALADGATLSFAEARAYHSACW